MDEERLESIARRLGEDAGRRVDADRLVERVLTRLRTEPPEVRRRPGRRRHWGRVAAAAVVVAAAGFGIRFGFGDRPVSQGDAVTSPAGLADLAPAELAEVMDSLDLEAPVSELVMGLDDLSEEQLETLLRRLEG